MNNHLRYMQFLCITEFFNNNDVTLRRNECDNLDNLQFFKITYPKVVIVTIIRLNRNILLNNFENICLVCSLKVCDFVMFDKHLQTFMSLHDTLKTCNLKANVIQ